MIGKDQIFFEYNQLISNSYTKNKFDDVVTLSKEYLSLSRQYKDNWNYGNAIHQAHTYLGLASLKLDQTEIAKYHLVQANNTLGSPQLKSFGPNMLLAKELLERGDFNTPIFYLNESKKYWKFVFRIWKLRKWIKIMEQGKIPEFGPHLKYHLLI